MASNGNGMRSPQVHLVSLAFVSLAVVSLAVVSLAFVPLADGADAAADGLVNVPSETR